MAQTIPNTTKVLLFSGAGLSSPLGLPMTDGFKDIINTGDSEVQSLLRTHLGPKFGDIEAILNAMEGLNSKDNIVYKHIENGSNSAFVDVKRSIIDLRKKSLAYTTKLKKSIHDKLATPNTAQCGSLYHYLLKEIKTVLPSSAISFFTANYDLTFEDSMDDALETLQAELQINDVDYGFIQKNGTLIFDELKKHTWDPSILEYKKIHGSLGWVIDTRGRITKSHAINTPDNPDSVPILYPGFKGSPTTQPFITLHRQFLQRLIEADYAIFMGFAFRDPYINSLVDMALDINTNLRVLCYNPSEIKNLPPESHIVPLIKSTHRFKYIKEGVAVTENPLNLASHIKKK